MLAMAGSSCADPTIVSARVSPVNGMNGRLNVYETAVTVRNEGTLAQSSSVLQSVAVYQDGTKVGELGLQPLKPGASQTVEYRMQRSAGAATGSTQLRFVLLVKNPHGPVSECSTAGHVVRLTI
jgi:hypothetical protein